MIRYFLAASALIASSAFGQATKGAKTRSPAVTAQIYAHALDESKADAIAGLSQKLRRDPARITHTITHTPTKKNPAPHNEERRIPHPNAGAGDGTRTRTGLPPTVFKTVASAISPLRLDELSL